MTSESFDKHRYDLKARQTAILRKKKENLEKMVGAGKYMSTHSAGQRVMEMLNRAISKEDSVLELGCFIAEPSIFLATQHPDSYFHALDVSPDSIMLASDFAGYFNVDITTYVASADSIPCPDDNFDFIHGYGALHHFYDLESVKEVERVLKPGGKAVFVEPTTNNPLILMYRKLRDEEYSPHERPFTPAMLRRLEAWAKTSSVSWSFHGFFTTFLLLGYKVLPGRLQSVFLEKYYAGVQSVLEKFETLFLPDKFINRFGQHVVIEISKKG